jgi:hypothetical protein
LQTKRFACICSALTLPIIACAMDQPAGPPPIPFADNRPPPCCHSDGQADRRLATGGLRRGDLARCSRARLAAARAIPKALCPCHVPDEAGRRHQRLRHPPSRGGCRADRVGSADLPNLHRRRSPRCRARGAAKPEAQLRKSRRHDRSCGSRCRPIQRTGGFRVALFCYRLMSGCGTTRICRVVCDPVATG